MRRILHPQADDNSDNDDDNEIESESYCLSNSGYTDSFHSEGLSRSSSSSNQKKDRASTKVYSTKSNSSGGTRRKDNDGDLDHRFFISRDLPTLPGIIIMIGVVLLFVIIIIGLLVYSNNKVKSGSSRRGETGSFFSGSSFSAKSGQSESYSDEIGKKAQRGFSNNCGGGISSSLPFLLGSRKTVYKNLVNIQPEDVQCYTWFTFLSLKIRMFWKSCNNPKHLFSNSNLFPPLLPSLSSVILKKWTSKAELVTFEIQLLDAIEVQGIALHLEEFQVQYYLRNNLSVQLYGNYRKSDDNHHDMKHHHYSDNQNPILLLDEKLTTQHLVVGDTGKQHILTILFLCQNKEKFSSLSLRLRSKSTILHQIISIEVLELKTYNQNR